ncbi:hypothetical protein WR25_20884 [Diploscapter pachys]|uniref:Serpentine receptor class gamma n=1 Tax=Diploscapter pachys TaxID=2018661 RepID=A0A2A2KSP8_9BILA|nr:hypothetical protein WR25_20884 [Diploscapter pachys]
MTTTRFIAIGYFCHELLDKYGHASYALAPLQFVMTYSRHSQFYIATVLSVNRMTAVMFPSRYEDIWERNFLPIVASVFILPIPTTWYLLPTQALLARYPMGGLTLTYVKLLPNPWNSVTYLTMIVGSCCGIAPFYHLCNYLLDNYVFWVCTCIKQIFIDIIFVFSAWSMIFFCAGIRVAIRDLYVKQPDDIPRSIVTVTPRKSTISVVA